MVSDIDIKGVAKRLVEASPLKGMISGGVYTNERPMNSGREDIAISVLTGDAAQLQELVLIINLFVPDINRGNEPVEDTKRLDILCPVCFDTFNGVHFEKVRFSFGSQRVMSAKDADEHFINNRVIAEVCCG